MPLPLEDNYTDVLGKAMRGLGLSPEAVAGRAGVAAGAVARLLDGDLDEAAARAVAPHLGLGADQLVALAQGAYAPDVAAPEGLAGVSTPYDDYHVNAYLVWDPASKEGAVFDTGADGQALLDAIAAHGVEVKHLFVTHTHPDHILALDALVAATGCQAHVSDLEPLSGVTPIAPGTTIHVGSLAVTARRTSGHSTGGITYVVTGLSAPLAIVGDALFAGSMGGGMVSWADALATNRREIFGLSDETVVCPGHGPLTTVGLEKTHNPCYPEFAS